jgi:integrase
LIESKKTEWKNAKHASQWTATLKTYAYPFIADINVKNIDVADIVNILTKIWQDKPETASRVRGRIEAVLDYAHALKYRTGDNPARWKGNLDHILPKAKKVKKQKHHAALDYQKTPEFMALLQQREGISARALEFTILTACRSGETRGATWQEIDFNGKIWIIPAERMKADKEHYIPLCDKALKILYDIKQHHSGNDYIFESQTKAGKMLSDMSLSAVLKRMDYKDITVHGFRSTFRDWAGETTHYPREVIEHALAHQLKDKAEAAYARGSLLAKRRELMDSWEQYAFNNYLYIG